MLKVVRAKLHGIFSTGADLNYHGSITLDPLLCKQIKIYPLEFVEIWNKNNGERFSTYVIFGEPNSRCCVLNGATARKCCPGDELIIAAYQFCHEDEISNQKPQIITFHKDNTIKEILEYSVQKSNDWFNFEIITNKKYENNIKAA